MTWREIIIVSDSEEEEEEEEEKEKKNNDNKGWEKPAKIAKVNTTRVTR